MTLCPALRNVNVEEQIHEEGSCLEKVSFETGHEEMTEK